MIRSEKTRTGPTTNLVIAGAGGSTHKTTMVANLACSFARRGRRVRVNDLDNQGDASQYLGYKNPPYVIGDVLLSEKVFPDPATGELRAPTLREIEQPFYRATLEEAEEFGGVYGPRDEDAEWMKRITVVPSGLGVTGGSLADAVTTLERDMLGSDRFLKAFATRDDGRPADEVPDLDIYDLHGTLGTLTFLSLRLADKVAAAVTPDDKAIGRHLDSLAGVVEKVSEFNPGLRLDAVIPREKSTRDGKFYIAMIEQLRADETYGPVSTPTVREAVTVPESFKNGEPLMIWVPTDEVTKDIDRVAEWFVEHGIVA